MGLCCGQMAKIFATLSQIGYCLALEIGLSFTFEKVVYGVTEKFT